MKKKKYCCNIFCEGYSSVNVVGCIRFDNPQKECQDFQSESPKETQWQRKPKEKKK